MFSHGSEPFFGVNTALPRSIFPITGSPVICGRSIRFRQRNNYQSDRNPDFQSLVLSQSPSLSATLPARPAPHGVPVCACTLLCRASRVAASSIFRTCRRHYPGGNGSVLLSFAFPNRRRPSPGTRRVGSHIAVFEACSMFTHVPTRAVAELLNATLCHRSASNHFAPSIVRPGCYQPTRQLLGGLRIPPGKRAFPRHTDPPRLHPTENDNCWVGFASHQENAPFHGALSYPG